MVHRLDGGQAERSAGLMEGRINRGQTIWWIGWWAGWIVGRLDGWQAE